MSSDSLPLSEVIDALRAEIMKSAESGANEAVRFELGPIEIELNLTATKAVDPGGKIEFKVLGFGAEIGGKGKISREHVQKIKFTLNPMLIDSSIMLDRTLYKNSITQKYDVASTSEISTGTYRDEYLKTIISGNRHNISGGKIILDVVTTGDIPPNIMTKDEVP